MNDYLTGKPAYGRITLIYFAGEVGEIVDPGASAKAMREAVEIIDKIRRESNFYHFWR